MSVVKLARVPERCYTLDELLGAVRQFENVQNVVIVVEDAEGATMLTIDGTTAERVNWLLDRAKRLVHEP